jgi:predicted AAA+ superfamily ATPase
MKDILTSEAGITVLGAILGAIWTFFKSTELYDRIRQKRYQKAVDSVESAVEETWRTYVESIKEGRADGRLLPGEKRRARQLARERAIAVGRDRGVDILRELGGNHLEVLTTRAMNRLQTR